MSSVAILCRGKSLGEINKLPICDKLILVNSFHNELEDPDISDYVQKHKSVIHITSIGAQFGPMIHKGIYKDYNIKYIVLPYIEEYKPPVASSAHYIFNIKDKHDRILKVKYLSDKNRDDMVKTHRYELTSPTCGMDSILYSVNDLDAKEINVIGMDFYDGVGYFTNSHGIQPANDEQCIASVGPDENGDQMKSFLQNFVKKHNDVSFNIFTMGNLESQSENLNVHKVRLQDE